MIICKKCRSIALSNTWAKVFLSCRTISRIVSWCNCENGWQRMYHLKKKKVCIRIVDIWIKQGPWCFTWNWLFGNAAYARTSRSLASKDCWQSKTTLSSASQCEFGYWNGGEWRIGMLVCKELLLTRATLLILFHYSQYHWWSCYWLWTLISMHPCLWHFGKTSGIQNIIWRRSSGKWWLCWIVIHITYGMIMVGTSQSGIIRTYQSTWWQPDTIWDAFARYCWLLYHWTYHLT